MKKWTRLVFVSIFVCIFNSCGTSRALDYPEPGLEKPFVFVIDTFQVDGSFEDYVKLHNKSSDSDIQFNVYFHNPKNLEWLLYGVGTLKGSGDTDTIDSDDSDVDDVDDYRYFAIESLNDKDYKYHCYTSRNDFHIDILDN
jgi:hypothetical protein